MALEGHGLAFLPVSSVRKELKSRRLVPAAPAGRFELTMDVRIYRERPGPCAPPQGRRDGAVGLPGRGSSGAEARPRPRS